MDHAHVAVGKRRKLAAVQKLNTTSQNRLRPADKELNNPKFLMWLIFFIIILQQSFSILCMLVHKLYLYPCSELFGRGRVRFSNCKAFQVLL